MSRDPIRPRPTRRALLMGTGALAAATATGWPAPAVAAPPLPPDEDGYDLWLRYRRVEDDGLLTSYRRALTHLVANRHASASAELRRGLTAMLGRDLPVSSGIRDHGAIVLGTPRSSALVAEQIGVRELRDLGPEGYLLTRRRVHGRDCLFVAAAEDKGVLYGAFHLLRLVQTRRELRTVRERPVNQLRLINHWDNLDRTVERGYAGESIFHWEELPQLLDRYTDYARALASVGINGTVVNNVNANAQFLSTEMITALVPLAEVLRDWGITFYLSANYACPILLGGLTTADPLDAGVQAWWRDKAAELYRAIPDCGGFLVKANSEGQPGPIDYGRTHADGANLIADAVRPYGGIVMWRAFVHDFDAQTWAHKSYQTFQPLDGKFAANVVLQMKNGPIDFQVREPVHPLFGALPNTNSMLELQITQEYTGQSTHLCYLVPQWKQVYDFDTQARGTGTTVARIVDGTAYGYSLGGVTGVVNFGDDTDWTRHQLAAANTHGHGRLAWNPALQARDLAEEWARMTYGPQPQVVASVSAMLLSSWRIFENYTSPLGSGFMIAGSNHFDPDLQANTAFHQASATHVGFDRTVATGIKYTELYHPPVATIYESLRSCPEELLLFFHRVPYTHRLKSGKTVIQHIYDIHFEGRDDAGALRRLWLALRGRIDSRRHADTLERLDAQFAHATVWRDTVAEYFFEKSLTLDEQRSWLQVRFDGSPPAFLSGTTTPSAVRLMVGNATAGAATATARLVTPDGWTSSPAQIQAGSREFATLEVQVATPQVEIGFGTMTAKLDAGSVQVLTGGRSTGTAVVTPEASHCALALDAGSGTSPLLPTYTRLGPADKWDPAKGYGWTGTGPQSRDRGSGLDPLRRDFVNDATARTLRIAVPAGAHTAYVLVGDVHDSQPTFVRSGGQVVAQSAWMPGWSFDWLPFDLDGGATGREVDLEFSSVPRQHWHLNALVLLKKA